MAQIHAVIEPMLAPADMPLKPNLVEITDALLDAGYSPGEIGTLQEILQEVAEAIIISTGTSASVSMTMSAHSLMEKIMPHRVRPAPGTLHERLNNYYLPAGWTFVHDSAKMCMIVALKIA
jgi:hypothetical protein